MYISHPKVNASGWLSYYRVRLSCGMSGVRVPTGSYQRPSLNGTNGLLAWHAGYRVGVW